MVIYPALFVLIAAYDVLARKQTADVAPLRGGIAV